MGNRALLKPYEEYKSTAIPWLGAVPSNWQINKIGALFEERWTKVSDKEYKPLTVGKMGVVPQLSTVALSNDSDNRKLVKKGDFVINSRSDRKGSSGLSAYDGSVSLINTVLTPRTENAGYLNYLLRSYGFVEEFYRNVRGIVADLWTTRFSEMKSIYLPIPPRSEQNQIVRFLDWKVSMINNYINAKKKQIALLREQKQAIINQAVTKGIDENGPRINTDFHGLSKIPTYWESGRLKHFAVINASITKIPHSKNDKVVFLPMENISVNGKIDNSIKRYVKDVNSGFSCFAKNDVVIAKITPCFENSKGAWLNNLETNIGFGTTELIVLRAKEKLLPEYLYYITKTSQFRLLGENKMTGSAGQKRISNEFVANYFIGLPAKGEQEEILSFIKSKCSTTDDLIESETSKIVLMQEYRTRLISDVVTGRVDVRNVAVPDINLSIEQYDDEMDEEGIGNSLEEVKNDE